MKLDLNHQSSAILKGKKGSGRRWWEKFWIWNEPAWMLWSHSCDFLCTEMDSLGVDLLKGTFYTISSEPLERKQMPWQKKKERKEGRNKEEKDRGIKEEGEKKIKEAEERK